MDFFKTAADSVSKAVNYVMDRNRKAALINRLNIVIRNERDKQTRAYLALGKYYYTRLRDPENEVTEPLCKEAETAGRRLRRAYAKLDDLTVPAEAAEKNVSPRKDGHRDDGYEDPLDGGSASEEAAEDEPAGPSDGRTEDEEEFLRPFTVVPNDAPPKGGTGDGGDGGD